MPNRLHIHGQCRLEELEQRRLLTPFSWSAAEVYFSELVNRARANPAAEAVRLGISLAGGLTSGEAALLAGAKEPLALSSFLTLSSRAHSADMAARDFFDHVNPDGRSPTARGVLAGYAGTAGENIGAGLASIDALYREWMTNPRQRKNILSLYTNFDASYHYDQLGFGQSSGTGSSAYTSYFTADFGNPSSATRTTTLLGVAFADTGNGVYDIGEGMAGVRVEVRGLGSDAVVGVYHTLEAGNYQINLSAGSYRVLFTQESTGRVAERTVVIGAQNVRLSIKDSELAVPPPPDDFADAGAYAQAGLISLSGSTGNGSISGQIEVGGDTDLFKFVASKTGTTRIDVSTTGGGVGRRAMLFSSAGVLLADGAAAGGAFRIEFSLVAGQTYHLLVQGSTAEVTGSYTASVEWQVPIDPPPPTGVPDEVAAMDGRVVSTLQLQSGRSLTVFVNRLGRSIVAERAPNGQWNTTDLVAVAGGAMVTGRLSMWTDTKDGAVYVAGASASGVLVYRRRGVGEWTLRNITAEVRVSRPITSDLSVIVDQAGLVQIAGRAQDGAVVTYWQTGKLVGGEWKYFFTDLFARDFARQERPRPIIVGELTGWTTSKNSLQMAARDADGNVLLFFRPGGGAATRLWNWSNLSQMTGTAPFVGTLAAFQSASGGINIAGSDANGNMWHITWRSGVGWRSTNAAEGSGLATFGPEVDGAPTVLGSYTAGAASYVVGLDADGRVLLNRHSITGGQSRWAQASMTASVPGAPALVGAVQAWASASGVVSIVGVAEDGSVVQFRYTPGRSWVFENVSSSLIV